MNLIRDAVEPLVGSAGILVGDDVHARSTDPFTHCGNRSSLLIRPNSTAQLSMVMAVLHEHRQPVVVQGGLTGVTGATQTGDDDVVISLERMNLIESIDPVAGTALVQAGVPIQAVEEAAAARDMFYPLDLGSRGTATVGGTIATNAGGNRVVRFGMTRNLVLGLEAVLADGTVVSSLNPMQKNNTGYDTKQLFIGSEGTLGIVTRAVLRLVPASHANNVALLACSNYDDVLELLQQAKRLQGLSAFEVMWNEFFRIVTAADSQKKVIDDSYQFYVLLETLGHNSVLEKSLVEEFLSTMLEEGVIKDAVIAQSQKQYEGLWSIRDAVEHVARAMSPMLSFDVSLAIAEVPGYIDLIEESLRASFPEFRACYFGHLGDGNIHVAMTIGEGATPADLARAESLVYAPFDSMPGSVSAEHGIGRHKREYLGLSKTAAEIDLMKSIKRTLDPHNLLNRDVIFSLQ